MREIGPQERHQIAFLVNFNKPPNPRTIPNVYSIQNNIYSDRAEVWAAAENHENQK